MSSARLTPMQRAGIEPVEVLTLDVAARPSGTPSRWESSVAIVTPFGSFLAEVADRGEAHDATTEIERSTCDAAVPMWLEKVLSDIAIDAHQAACRVRLQPGQRNVTSAWDVERYADGEVSIALDERSRAA